jgi:hypothetical protein
MTAVGFKIAERCFDFRAWMFAENVFAADKLIADNARSDIGRHDYFDFPV